MKPKTRRQALLGFLLFGLLTLTLLRPSYGQESDYYIVDGQRITLTPSDTYEAVEVRPGTEMAFQSEVQRTSTVAVQTEPLLREHDVILLRKNPASSAGAFNSRVRALSRNAAVETTVPVYEVGGIEQVLVNEFLVQFKAGVSSAAAEDYLKENGAEIVVSPNKIANRYTIRFPERSPRDALKVVNGFNGDESVAFAEPNFVRIVPKRPRSGPTPASGSPPPAQSQPAGDNAPDPASSTDTVPEAAIRPNDAIYSRQWALRNIGNPGVSGADIAAPDAWTINKGSDQVTIAIIDEGVDVNHADLRNKIVTPYDATDGDDDQQPKPWDGHGTACAGIAAATTNNTVGVAGVSWGARILPVRIAFSDYRHGPWVTSNAIIEDGIRTAVDRGAHVLSNSWGGGSPSSAINSAIDHAIANNRVVVFAAGNDSGPVGYPASLSVSRPLIAVSATNEWDELKTNASQDGEDWWGSNFGPQINVAAPGVHILTTDITGTAGYDNSDYTPAFNGTSSATPFVAGAAAVLLAQVPMATPTQVRGWLEEGAKDLAPAGFDNQFGHGRLNLLASLQRAAPLKVALNIDQPNGRLERGQQTLVTAEVTRGGSPSSGVAVTFASADSQLASVAPTTATTDDNGTAQAQVRGETNQRNSVDITAQAQGARDNKPVNVGVSDSKPVKVPAWPAWSLLLLGAAALIRARW